MALLSVNRPRLADRVGIIHAGRLLCLAPTAEVLSAYGAADLHEAFVLATGRAITDEDEDETEQVAA